MAPPIAGRIKQQMTMNLILIRLVMKIDERRTMIPMTPVGICMRMVWDGQQRAGRRTHGEAVEAKSLGDETAKRADTARGAGHGAES
jgi:hypothetical protein